MLTKSKILTVLVVHEMNLMDSCAFVSLTQAVARTNRKGRLFVYDNSKLPQAVESSAAWNIVYRHDPLNRGVGHAYNQAFIDAQEHDLDWMLLADQDTFFPSLIYSKFEESIDTYSTCSLFAPILLDKIGVVSPFKRRLTSGKRIQKPVIGSRSLNDLHVINSGLLVRTSTFALAGGYAEKLRLDFSDSYFLQKVQKYTEQIVIIDSECRHSHSSSEVKTKSQALERFRIYLESIQILSHEPKGYAYVVRAFMRAIKLSIMHRSFQFINIYLSN